MKRHVTLDRLAVSVSRGGILLGAAIVLAELLLVVGYFGTRSDEPTSVRYVLYPFVWINLGIWAVVTTPLPSGDRLHRWIAGAIAGAYFLVLIAIAGLIGVHPSQTPAAFEGFRFIVASPGWGPVVAYVGSTFHLTFVPYLVVGYLSLSYLVYVTVLDATRAIVSGVLGLLSCVGCTFPIVASLIAGIAGGTSSLTTAVYSLSMDLSTLVFVLAVLLLYWRPTVRS